MYTRSRFSKSIEIIRTHILEPIHLQAGFEFNSFSILAPLPRLNLPYYLRVFLGCIMMKEDLGNLTLRGHGEGKKSRGNNK